MKRVVELEIQLENVQHGAVSSSTSNESHSVDSKDMAGLKIRIKSLERELQKKKEDAEKLETKMMEQAEKSKAALETLQRKDHEMQAMEERYKKYIEKAKMVLKTLDPKHNPALNVTPEVAALQAQLKEKDKLIERLEVEAERHKALRDNEDQLVTTAFYNLGMQLQRQAMEQRLGSSQSVQQNQASVAPSPPVAAPAQGFLTRQRQAAARGRNTGESYN